MGTPLGVMMAPPVVYTPTKFEADRPNGLEIINGRTFLKGPSIALTLCLDLSLTVRKSVVIIKGPSNALVDS